MSTLPTRKGMPSRQLQTALPGLQSVGEIGTCRRGMSKKVVVAAIVPTAIFISVAFKPAGVLPLARWQRQNSSAAMCHMLRTITHHGV